jgi:hypothetical protein
MVINANRLYKSISTHSGQCQPPIQKHFYMLLSMSTARVNDLHWRFRKNTACGNGPCIYPVLDSAEISLNP